MPTPVFYTGDTWPPLILTAKDANGNAVDLSTADSLRVIAKSNAQTPDVIAGTAAFCPVEFGGTGDGTDGRSMYPWAATDLSAAGTYVPELEVTWDTTSTPPKVETFRDDSQTFIVKADND